MCVPMRGVLMCVLMLSACAPAGVEPGGEVVDPPPEDAGIVDAEVDAQTDAMADPDAFVPPVPRAAIAHDFGDRQLDPFQEMSRCVQWTLNNDEPIYIEGVSLANGGAFHHSNWFVVPEDVFEGRDGYFRCGTREFNEFRAALKGTVLFAQSTQSLFEEQRLGEGVVIRVPPRHKVIANVHFLNLAAAPVTTHLYMTLDLVHPRGIRTIVTPFRFSYLPLELPPLKASRFTSDCDLRAAQNRAGQDFAFKLHWLLPHYHALGNYFDVTVRGGRLDGESIMRLDQFNAEPNGKVFDPPLDLDDMDGLAVTCGYDNPRRESVGWGIGDQEMCVMLGFAQSELMMDASVIHDRDFVSDAFGIESFDGDCVVLALEKSDAHAPPDAAELDAAFYIPAGDDVDAIGGRPTCVDTPSDADPLLMPTAENVSGAVFLPSCSFTACHGGTRPAVGLRLDQSDPAALRQALQNHAVASSSALPLVAPGDPMGSLLYRRMADCAPEDGAHMPLNAPTLLPPERVALVRDWIAEGLP